MPIDFKSIKSLFVVEDPAAADKAGSEAPITSPGSKATEPSASIAPTRPGEANPKFIEVLVKSMEAANLPGVDYLEYRQSVKSLEKMPMEEAVRYQSAFAMAQAMGATPAKLVESAAHYMAVLKTEQSKFDEALRKQTTDRIGNRQEMLKNLDATLKQKAEQIKKLTQEMEAHRVEMEKLDVEIKDATSKVETTKNDFLASYQTLVAQISHDVENMKRFLK
jgi:hypothetical protein